MLPIFSLKFDNAASRGLEKLPRDVSSRIWNKLQQAKAAPFNFFFQLKGRKDYKMRVGDYRVIADINMMERTIEITKIGHRRNVYD